MANINPTPCHRGAFHQGWHDALKAKHGTRNRYKNLSKDNWMVIGFRFNDELGSNDEELFLKVWNWSVKEYNNHGNVDPKKFLRESGDESLRQKNEIETYVREGKGFPESKANREVERAAVSIVTDWYEEQDWLVESVENQKVGYDLFCRKGAIVQCVEVKGIGSSNPAFIITEREYREAQTNPDFVICIVTAALSNRPRLFYYSGDQFINDFTFEPIAHRAWLKNE